MHRGSAVVFAVIVAVLGLIGSLVMALVLASVGSPDAIVVGVVLAAVPVGPVLGCYLWLDRYEPEPRGLLVAALLWGALVATSLALVAQAFDAVLVGRSEAGSAIIVAPVTEEAAKGLFVVLLVWLRRHQLHGVLDGIVYAGFVGVGFAFSENILYLSAAYLGDLPGTGSEGAGGLGTAVVLFVLRGVFSPFAHPVFTGFIGIGVGLAVVSRSGLVRALAPTGGFVTAVWTHSLWNSAAVQGAGFITSYLTLMVPAFLLLVGFALWVRSREGRLLHSALTDVADRGLLHPAEVPWLTRLPARRASRRHAAATRGRAGVRAMRDYQRAAVELGFLHHRWLRGRASRDASAHGQRLLEEMRRLRPHVSFPSAAMPGLPLGSRHSSPLGSR